MISLLAPGEHAVAALRNLSPTEDRASRSAFHGHPLARAVMTEPGPVRGAGPTSHGGAHQRLARTPIRYVLPRVSNRMLFVDPWLLGATGGSRFMRFCTPA